MKVVVVPADLGGCGHYRLIWPARALIDQGADVELIMPESDDPQLQGIFQDATDLVTGEATTKLVDVPDIDCDVLVIQRPLKAVVADAIPHYQAKGIRVVVEIDDDFAAIHHKNVSWLHTHPAKNEHRNWNHLQRACRYADLVTVTTPALAKRYGGHGRVQIVPNLIPERYLKITKESAEGLYLGWSGSIYTHPEDLQVTNGGIEQALRASGAKMAVVGTGHGVQAALRLTEPPIVPGWVELDDYPQALAQFDVGIVPLQRSAFNEAKSCLKMMEMASVGVPVVASPTSDNERLFRMGIGWLASDRAKDWHYLTRRLLENPQLRLDMGLQARVIMAGLTIEAHCGRWWDAWSKAMEGRRVA